MLIERHPLVFQEVSEATAVSTSHGVANGISATEDSNNGAPTASRFGLRHPGINAAFLTRTRSATSGILQQRRSLAM